MPLQTLDRADVKDGFISGVASTPSTDAFGHSVCAGAFDRSIKAKGLGGPKGVKLLAGHVWAKLIGVITRLEAVGDALRIEAQLNLDIVTSAICTRRSSTTAAYPSASASPSKTSAAR
jgi:hypothetical protein